MMHSIYSKSITLLLFASLYLMTENAPCFAQYENIWAIGTNAGIDFNSNPPKAIRTSMNAFEGSASICNDQGQLLFYSEGSRVWDRNHNVMFNGNDLISMGTSGTWSTSQACCIVPIPGQHHLYYIFSLSSSTGGTPRGMEGRLYFSVVDMNLNNGMGDVLPGSKGIILDSLLTEHMTAVSGSSCNVWLLVTSKDNRFKAYNIDLNGIDKVPIVSTRVAGSGLLDGVGGSIDVAPSGSKLAIAQGNFILYDFERNTGKITNPFILAMASSYYYYGACFSPDNSKLYGSIDWSESPLYQFDLSSNNSDTIIASKTQIAVGHYGSAVKRGPDGKVYCARNIAGDGTCLSVIHQPNLAGTACQYANNDLPLLSGTQSSYGLPNNVPIIANRKIFSNTSITAYCSDSFFLEAKTAFGTNYVWEDGSTGKSRYVKNKGTYWLRYQASGSPCDEDHVDTFHTIVLDTKGTISTYTGMCSADTFLMTPTHPDALNYTWEDGSTGKTRTMNRSGTFWVRYKKNTTCELFVDTFQLSYPERDYEVSFTSDTFICQQQLLSLNNTSDTPYQSFYWIWGDGLYSSLKDPNHLYVLPGTYKILLTGRINDKCVDSFTHLLQVDAALPLRFVVDRDQLCVGESITVSHQMNSNTIQQIVWQWGDGKELRGASDYSIPHAYDNAGLMPVTIQVDFRSCPDDSFSIPIQVFAPSEVRLYSENGLCFQGVPLTLKNLKAGDAEKHHNLWSTGSVADSIRVTHYGTYSLTVSTEPLGCITTETIEISKDCYIDIPNAFTPNSDGINDCFFPRQLLSKNVSRFKMQVFNRWGMTVFETNGTDGRGWDGQFNGNLQPDGVYIYKIALTINRGVEEIYQGNVTLIR